MKFLNALSFIILSAIFSCGHLSAQTLRNPDDEKRIAPTVQINKPDGIFTIYDGKTLRKGDFTFSPSWANDYRIITSTAKITAEKAQGLKVTESILPSGEKLSKVYFVNEKIGWLASNDTITKSLYKTNDAGRNWEKVNFLFPRNSYVSNFFFLSDSIGWIILQTDENYVDTHPQVWLLKTLDGGNSWQIQMTKQTFFGDLFFQNEKNGWLVAENQLLKTGDGGKTWENIAPEVRQINGFTDSKAIITGLIVENQNQIQLITRGGKLLETLNSGQKWHQIGPIFNFPDQTIPDNFGKLPNSRKLRMARGTWSEEGTYSYIAIEEKGIWKLRWTDKSFCLYDILFLSDAEFIMSGRDWTSQNQEENGAIYYSSDAGATWLEVYRNKSISQINSIAKITDNHLIAVGENGLILNIELENPAN